MTRPLNDTTYLYGIHDPGGEHLMLNRDMDGWVLVTVAIGHDAADMSPGDERRFLGDFRQLTKGRLGVIVRLNNGYGGAGTLPFERFYDDFARRCANFVSISKGAHLWIVGNETNHPIEWPGADWDWSAQPPRPKSPDKEGEAITPDRYVRCYRKVRQTIHALAGHEQDQVLVAGPAPWNNLLSYPANPHGDWVQYLADVLSQLGPDGCDGIALHSYTHGSDPSLITSDAKVGDPRFSNYHWHFRAYRDYMGAIPASMRHLPVYLTETDQGDVAWEDRNSGWVREAYQEIDRWNQAGSQQIRSLILYRWPRHDKWFIEGKQGVIEDFTQSFAGRYQWQEAPLQPDIDELRLRYEAILAQFQALEPELAQVSQDAAQAQALAATINDLADDAKRATDLRNQVNELSQEVTQIEAAVSLLASAAVPVPPLDDVRDDLPTHASKRWPNRELAAIQRVVVHHTATSSYITPQRVAQFHVQQGHPGIKYHYMINGDGVIYWTQPLEAVVAQTTVSAINDEAIAVTLAGNFNATVPGEAQMASAASLIAWLLSGFHLSTGNVVGRVEVDSSDPSRSPGRQWMEGARYKDTLLAQAQAILDGAAMDQEQQLELLRERIRELEAQVAALQVQADQVPLLQQEIQALHQQVDQQQAQISRLTASNSQLQAETARLWNLIQSLEGGGIPRPRVLDVVDSLPRHPTLRYENRTSPISAVVIHHTDTRDDITVDQIAHYHVWGTSHDANGNLVKGEWPGIGYHYVILPDGTIYWTQRHETRSYHARDANAYSVGISLIGRFMGGALPSEAQMESTSQLTAWLLQEFDIADIERVLGHQEVSSTSCPGDQWLRNATWKQTLHRRIQQVATAGRRPVEYCLLFWDHGDNWAQQDWVSAQSYIAHFRPMTTFTSDEALAARHVVIVGGEAGVSGQDEARLQAAGCSVYRLAGADEAETRALLDALVAANTPYPGAPPAPSDSRTAAWRAAAGPAAALPPTDEWTVPDDYEAPPDELTLSAPTRVKVETIPPSQPA